jgi:hypothetical protein
MIGLLVLMASPVLIPLAIWIDYNRWIKRRQPGPPLELAKASHGAGMIWLAVVILILMNDQGAAVTSSPVLWVPFGVMAVWGALGPPGDQIRGTRGTHTRA